MSKKKVLGKFTILRWAAFIAILGCGLHTPGNPNVMAFQGGLSGGD